MLKVLLTNCTLAGRTGTELVVRELVEGLQKAGHRPAVYSPRLGPVALEIQALGVPVVDDLRRLTTPPQIIHGHHHIPTVQALLHFPSARGLFVCHDGRAATDVPPRLPRLRRHVAVDLNCRERLIGHGLPETGLHVIHNWVDLARFAPRAALPAQPRRALVFSNYAGPGPHLDAIRAACGELGLDLDVLGAASGNLAPRPERVLGGYDVIFAKARCALEALAVGAAVVLCDTPGLGPMVTEADVDWLRRWNFGYRLLREPVEPARIVRELRRYDPHDAQRASRYLRAHAGFPEALAQYVDLYRAILAEPADDDDANADGGLASNLEALLTHTTALERRHCAVPGEMVALDVTTSERVRLARVDAATMIRARRGQPLAVPVRISNASLGTISSAWPHPIRLSYRWLSPDRQTVVVREGIRSELSRPVAGGEELVCSVRVVPPDVAGPQVLRLTLVQELVRWFDELPEPRFIDFDVVVD